MRWHHPERGPVPPSEFIPAAEATGSIGAISDFVLSTVAADLAEWDTSGMFPAQKRISINMSAAEFNRRDFLDRLRSILDAAQLDPQRIELEITESLLVDDLRAAAERLRMLDRQGVHVALDDFGTGYSSLSYLHQLPLHTLKIDRRFIGDFSDDRAGTITRTIVALAHNLGVVAVAEGLEHERQRRFLDECGCDLAQGFLFAPPLPRAGVRSIPERLSARGRGLLSLMHRERAMRCSRLGRVLSIIVAIGRPGRRWQRHDEHRAAPGTVLDVDSAPVIADDPLRQRESQPGTAAVTGSTFLQTGEALEDPFTILDEDALTVI